MKPRTLTAPERLEDRYAMDATGLIDIPAVRLIAEHAYLQLHAELGANIWTSWERYGTSGTGGILRSIGTGDGNPGNPDNPSATDALALQFSTPITRPTTVKLWTEGMAPTSVYAWVNSAQRRIDAGSDGTIRIDASAQNPINNLSILGNNGGTGRYGIDSFDIAGDPQPDPVESPDQAPEPAAGSQPDAGTNAPSGDIVLPGELDDLLAEAIALSRNGPEWRTPETGEVVASALRKGLHLNLRAAEAPVVGLRATVAANGAAVTASVYRGTEVLATVAVPTDGAFSYAYENGFTDVLFTTANAASMSITNAHITTDETMQPIGGETIGIMTSKPYALAAAPVVPIPNDVAYVAGTLKFTTSSSIGTDSRRYFVRDPSLFTLITINASGGSGRITMVGTIKKEGVDYRGREYGSTSGFPEGYARWVADGVVAIAPGAPAPISFIASGPGTFSVTQAQTLEELLPPATMSATTLDTDIMTMNDQFQTAGIFPPLAEVREGSSPVFANAGDIANVQYHIRNKALAGGSVTAKVYVGWHGGEPTRGTLQGTFTLAMGGIQTQRVSANVTAPAKPADATSDRPIISMVLTLPNGTAVLANAKLGKEPKSHEKRVFTDNGDGTTTMRIESGEYTRREQARIHALTDRALNALLSTGDKRLVAARTVLGDDHIVDLIAKNTAAALAVADGKPGETIDLVMAKLDEGMEQDVDDVFRDREGVGGSENVAPSTEKLLARGSNARSAEIVSAAESVGLRTPGSIYTEAMSWTIPVSHALQEEFLAFDLTTIAGRILGRGIMRMHDDLGNESAQWQTAFMIQAITDIPAYMLMDVANAGSDIAVARNFKALMEKAQYAHIALPTAGPSTPAIVMAAPNKLRYDNGDTDIRIRFDVGATASGVKSVQVFNGTIPVGGARSIGFVTVPIMSIPSLVPPSTGPLPEFVECNLTIKVVLEDGTVLQRTVDRFEMDIHLPDVLKDPPSINGGNYESITIGNYSTLSNTTENAVQREKENWVLSVLAANPPFHNDNGEWSVYIGSGAHDSNSFYALDINRAGNDRDQEILSPAPGTITSIGGSIGVFEGTNDEQSIYGTIVITHDSFGSHPSWKSKILHAPLYKTSETEASSGKPIYMFKNANGEFVTGIKIWEGKRVNPKDTVAITAGRGPIFNADGSIRKDAQGRTIISDMGFSSHIHYEPLVDEKAINATDMIFSGWHIPMSATDDRDGTATIQDWNPDLHTSTQQGMLVNNDQRLVFFRDIAITDNHANDVWLAWEGDDVTKMKRVVWVHTLPSGQVIDAWLDANDFTKKWNFQLQSWENI